MQLSPAAQRRPDRFGRVKMNRTSSWAGQRPSLGLPRPTSRTKRGRSAIIPRRISPLLNNNNKNNNNYHGSYPSSPSSSTTTSSSSSATSSPFARRQYSTSSPTQTPSPPSNKTSSNHINRESSHSPSSPQQQMISFQKSQVPSPSTLIRESLLAKSLSSPPPPSSSPLTHSRKRSSTAGNERGVDKPNTYVATRPVDNHNNNNNNKARNRKKTFTPEWKRSSSRSLSTEVKIQHSSDQLKSSAASRAVQRDTHRTLQSQRIHSIMEWIFALTGERVTMFMELNGFSGCFPMSLKSGKMLCLLVNRIQPHTITKINYVPIPRLAKENIAAYIGGCRSLGIPEEHLFEVEDLYDERGLDKVLRNLEAMKVLYENKT